MSVEPDRGYLVAGKSLTQIGDFMRRHDDNPARRGTRVDHDFIGRKFEGVLLEDLNSAPDLDTPQKAQFQIKTLINDSDALSNDGEIEVWSRARYASFKTGDYGMALELYENIFYWFPMDCSQPTSSSSSVMA